MAPRMDRAAQRAALLELGAAVANEMRAGQSGARTVAVGDALAAIPQATLEIVGLIGREARRRRPDAHLVAALAFMCGQSLERLRYGVERADPAAAAMLDAVRGRLVAEARSERADPNILMLLTKQFAIARLDIGEELRGAMGDILDEEADEAAEAGAGDLDMERHLVELAGELGDDPFAIHQELAETASSFPIDHRLAMATFMLASESAPVKDAALGWLFDPDPEVALALAAALGEEARIGRLGGTALRRLVTARNWLPGPLRDGIDAAVRAARRKGEEPTVLPPPQVDEIRLSAVDGSGAVSVFAMVRTARRYGVASVLLKFGAGVRDAWVQRDLTRTEARDQIARIADEIDLVPASPATLRLILSHMLSLNAAGRPPVFGVLDAIEALGLGTINPEAATPEAIVDQILAEAEPALTSGPEVQAEGAAWPRHYAFMQSWFEDGADVDAALLGRKGLSRPRRIDLVLEHVVAPRRRRWGEMLAWMALITADSGSRDEALRFAAAAREALGDRSVREIPLLRAIAENTIEARRQRRGQPQ